jgi:hypothetical protein
MSFYLMISAKCCETSRAQTGRKPKTTACNTGHCRVKQRGFKNLNHWLCMCSMLLSVSKMVGIRCLIFGGFDKQSGMPPVDGIVNNVFGNHRFTESSDSDGWSGPVCWSRDDKSSRCGDFFRQLCSGNFSTSDGEVSMRGIL